jgi:DNA-binding NtrC family response regulator
MPSAHDLQLLTSYPWPGNIRELASVIDRAAILGEGKRLEMGKALGVSQGQASPPSFANSSPVAGSAPAFLSLDEAMKQHIEAALDRTHGQIEGKRGAAALLKINPHTLRARMRKLKIDWSRYRQEE